MTVRFIARGKSLRLTVGSTYEVVHQTETRYYVSNDSGTVQPYDVRLFEVVNNDETQPTEAPQQEAPRRRGRPTNAELAARRAAEAQVAPVETEVQRRNRIAREEAARQAEQERREEARRVEEENRRGRVRTEEDCINSITVSDVVRNDHNLDHLSTNTAYRYDISYDQKQRMNDPENRRSINNLSVYFMKYNAFSCGIGILTGIESFIAGILSVPNYQENDFDQMQTSLISKVFNKLFADIRRHNNSAILTVSVTMRDTRVLAALESVGFVVNQGPVRNPNSTNNIVLLSKTL